MNTFLASFSSRHSSKPRTILAAGIAAMLSWQAAQAASIIKAPNSTNLDQPESWLADGPPSADDIAVFNDALLATTTVSLGSDLEWQGVSFASNLAFNVTISSGNTLTVGSSGIELLANKTATLNNPVTLSASQTWNVTTGTFIPAGGVNLNGHDLTLDGSRLKQFKGNVTGGGSIIVDGGEFRLGNGKAATTIPVIAHLGTTVNFETGTGPVAAARVDSLTLNGATLTVGGNSSANSVDSIANALTIDKGGSVVTLTPVTTRHAQISAASLVRNAGGVVLFRGNSLGASDIASAAIGTGNIVFGTAPALSGGNGMAGPTTTSILVGAYGDTTSSGDGFGATGGLVTYDANGIRVLGDNEYASLITDGQTQLDNVRIENNTGTPATTTLNSATTVNSLSLRVNTTPGSGITLDGTGTLKLASGVFYASETVPSSTTADTITINLPALDLNGKEGIFLFNTVNSGTGGTSGGLVIISSKLTNDGGNGVTFRGAAGTVKLTGSVLSDYTGTTTVDGGNLWLARSGVDAIPGNLVINSGAVINSNNQIPDNADITINGGTLHQKQSLNSGTGASDTFRDLFMTGGNYNDGASGTSSGSTSMRDATISGGVWSVTKGHTTTMSGSLTVNGGAITITNTSDNTHGGFLITHDLSITNTPSGAYTPIVIGAATGAGAAGKLVLLGDLSFTGNSTNTNTTTIEAPSATKVGTIALDGVRTFNIGDGAATVDLAIAPALIDNDASFGGITKTGPGTLVLSGPSTYSGATTVNAGALVVTGSLNAISPVAVNAGTLGGTGFVGNVTIGDGVGAAGSAIFAPGGDGTIGAFATGSLSLANNDALFKFELSSTDLTADSTNLIGTLALGPGLAGFTGTDLLTAGLSSGTQFTLATATDGITGFFSGYGEGTSYTLGANTYRISYGVDVPNSLTLTVVPEPASGVLLLGALGILPALRRRRSAR